MFGWKTIFALVCCSEIIVQKIKHWNWELVQSSTSTTTRKKNVQFCFLNWNKALNSRFKIEDLVFFWSWKDMFSFFFSQFLTYQSHFWWIKCFFLLFLYSSLSFCLQLFIYKFCQYINICWMKSHFLNTQIISNVLLMA